MKKLLIALFAMSSTLTAWAQPTTLKDAYRQHFKIGVAVNQRNVSDSIQAEMVAREFNSVTAENDMKPKSTHPQEGHFNWERADRIADFCRSHGLKMRGHCLLWHNQIGEWMLYDEQHQLVSKEVLFAHMRDHIAAIVGRYKDVVYCWDVVNEAITDDPNTQQPLRPSLFYQICQSDEFIRKAFEYAREADPDALLFYNDYNECNPVKRDRICKMVSEMKADGVPIDGIGMQGHYNISYPSEQEFETAIQCYAKVVDHIHITELDVRTNKEKGGQLQHSQGTTVTEVMKRRQQAQYDMLFGVMRRNSHLLECVTFWNLSDRDSWLGEKNYPLLFDRNYQPKAAYYTVRDFVPQVTFYTPRSVRIHTDSPRLGSMVVKAKPEGVKVSTVTKGDITTYRTSALTVSVNTRTGQVSFADHKGNPLLKANGLDFHLDRNEPIYGLGMLQNGKMNQRGEHRLMTQSNLEDYAHCFQSLKGYGIYWDNYSPTQINDKGDVISLRPQVNTGTDYYFMYGGTADGVVSEMRHLTGHVPMLPLWTYGFHQSRERYKSSRELLEVVDTYQRMGIPLDGIIQDWQYWGGNYLWNAMDFLNEDFRDYRHMIDHVHQLGKHISISVWASFGPHTLPYRELDQKGLLYDFETWPQSGLSAWPPNMDYPSGVRVYDPYSSEARDIYWKHLSRLHGYGIDGWWMDSTDPDHHSIKESDFDQFRPVGNPSTGGDTLLPWRAVRNAFPLATVEGVYDHQRTIDSLHRVFILTRSYFAGQQRTGANTWSGDVQSSWDSFRKQVPLCLNYTMTANPHVNTDLGGFFAGSYNQRDMPGTQNPQYHELYVRWMQFGVFCPMMRSHGTEVPRELYLYGKPGEPVFDALLGAVRLRYQLLPYIYSTSWQVSHADDSFMRPLVMDFSNDPKTWDNCRQFMFGHSLLVAPVVEALYTPEAHQQGVNPDWGARKTYDVYLPQGTRWYDFWTGQAVEGGQTLEADAPLAHCPVFVRAGSILPLCKKEVMHADIADWQTLDINVYPGCDGQFTLYEDEGDNYNYERGQRSTIEFRWNERSHTLAIGKRMGDFPGMSANRQFRICLPDGTCKVVDYKGIAQKVKL